MNKEKNHPTARHTILPAEWEPQSGITVMQDGHPAWSATSGRGRMRLSLRRNH